MTARSASAARLEALSSLAAASSNRACLIRASASTRAREARVSRFRATPRSTSESVSSSSVRSRRRTASADSARAEAFRETRVLDRRFEGRARAQDGRVLRADLPVIAEPAQLEVLPLEGPAGGIQGLEIGRVLLAGEKRSTGPPKVLFLKVGFKNLRRDRRGSTTKNQNSQENGGCLAEPQGQATYRPLILAMAALTCSMIAAALSLMTTALSLAPK